MNTKQLIVPVLALFTGWASLNATPVGIGGNVAGPVNTVFQGGTLVSAQLATAVATATFAGTARSAVYRNAGGTLDFYYQFANSGPDDIGRLSFFNFDGFTTDVFNITDGSLVGGTFANGTVDSVDADRGANPTLNSVGFNYSAGSFLTGTTSLALLVRTNATAFTTGSFSVIDGSTSTTPSFQPTASVPDGSSTLVLFSMGLAGIAAGMRNRRKFSA